MERDFLDILSFYYFSELAKDMHITRTASRLFISQQTLSNHIQRLEEGLGVQLLYRKPVLSLTYAGEQVLEFSKTVTKGYTNLTDILADIQQQERGTIRFGASPLRLNALLPSILPEFSKRYPNVQIHISDAFSAQLEPMILRGDIDFAVVLSGKHNPRVIDQHLMYDQVYLCVSDKLLTDTYGERAAALKENAMQGVSIADFSDLPVCLHSNRLGMKIRECFDELEITPKIYTISADTRISLSLCFKGLAACFATHMRLFDQRDQIPDDLNIFPVLYKGEPLTQRLSLIRHNSRYIAQYSKYFLELLFQYFNDIEHNRIERIANETGD